MTATVYTEPMARGVTTLRRTISNYFSIAMPKIIDVMRVQHLDLDEAHLPYPVAYDTYDPMHHTEYPVVGAYVPSTEQWRRVERLPSGSMVYEAAYDTLIYVVAKTVNLGQDDSSLPDWEQPERESAMVVRDNLHAALRSTLLSSLSLGTAGEEWRVVVDDDSIREQFPDPIQSSQTNVWICSGVINVTIMVREAIASPIYGPLLGVDTTVDLIDDTP